MMKAATIVGAGVLATAIGGALWLRPHPTAREHLAEPVSLPPAARPVLRTKMGRHDLQMRALMSRVVLLDDDGIARAAGEIFDEPALARPITGDELNNLLPPRFFDLQDELRTRARRLVAASGRHDRAAVAEEFAALAKSCVACHDVYLREPGASAPRAEQAP
jgi:cytochrome c'